MSVCVRYAAAELDCSMALSIDAAYLKAYHRRGTARAALSKYHEAKQDFERVLRDEPKNRQARQELEKIERVRTGRRGKSWRRWSG